MSNPFPTVPGGFTPSPAPGAAPTSAQVLGGQQFAGGTLTNYNDIFGALLEYRWREIGVPVERMTMKLVQDQIVHKFIDRDGAHVEGVGRAPIRFTAKIPFLVGLSRGANETWQKPLYPFTFRKFFAACADRTSGTLQHPEFGDFLCKLEDMETTWEAGVRAGVWVTATWIETDDTQDDLTQALDQPSPLAGLLASAADLDTQRTELDPALFPQPYTLPAGTTFSSIVASVRNAIDTVTLLQQQYGGQIANVIYQAQSVEDAADLAINANALNWPIYNAAELAKDSAYQLQTTLLNKQTSGIGQYSVPKDATISEIAINLGSAPIDLMQLNAAAVGLVIIPAGFIIRFYQ